MVERYQELLRRRQEAKENGEEAGFTLIELLIVIVVLGVLAAIVIFALSGVTGQSAQSACNADAKSVEIAEAAFHTQTGNWPAATTDLTNVVNGSSYLHSWPNNPSHYTIGLGTAGIPTVTVAGSQTATPYDSQAAANGNNPATGCYAVS
jgi:general secretion pathway protein G